jgi:dipeptidyl aminopeptidase/acylaminoacyl peptidase
MLKSLLVAFTIGASFLTFTAASVSAQQQQSKDMMPPLIDREIFFGNPEIAGAQISPDGRFISFIKPYKNVRNIWVKGVSEPFEKARVVTAEAKRPIPNYFWSRDGKYILFVKDNDGDENYNVYAVNPAEAPAAGADTPAARNLTDAKKARAFIYNVPETDPDAIYVGLNDREPAWHDLYKVKISTGERTLIRKNTERLTGWVFDHKDRLRLATRTTPTGETEILRVDADGKFTKVYSCGVFEACGPVAFHKDDRRVYLQTNKGDNVDLIRLVLFDPESGREEFVEEDPLKRVDFGGLVISDKTKNVVLTRYTDDKTRLYFKDKAYEKDYNTVKKLLGDREISFNSSTKDENLWIISSFSDVDPGTVWLYDRKTRNLSTLYQVREKLPREALAKMQPIRYKSSDGLEIPAYLTLPKGVEPKNLPLVVVPHGGPWGRDTWGYNSIAQFLANRGYAVLMPNFRASTGFGKKFLNAGNKQWGQLMQDDITWGVKHLVAQGVADPKRVGIMGGSYGGYATLAGVTYTPDLYAAAVAIVAPSNLITLLESIPPYWEAGKIIFYERMGNPNTPEGRELLTKQSPLTYADRIKTPLLVVQGANDPRVNKRESDQIVVALRDRGYPVEYLLAPDEGHGFARPVNNMAMFARGEEFLAKYLGGRFQPGGTPEVMQRLKEITVDVKTVTAGAKKPATNSAPSVNVGGKWNMTANVGGDTVEVTLDLKQNGADFTGTVSSMHGGGTLENGKISGNNLTATLNVEIQGQAFQIQMEGKIEGDKMTGTMSAAGLPQITFTATKAN